MEKLHEHWLTEGLIDFEYKKYVLLAYLQHVKQSFDRTELYPFMGDLVFHYRNLISIRDNKQIINQAFPKELSAESLRKLELTYKQIVEDDAVMRELESIIDYALPRFKSSLDEGSVIYDYVESQCEISPIGLTSLYAAEGYLFVTQPPERETQIFRYQITFFEGSQEKARGLHTRHIATEARTITNTYEQIKLKLIRSFTDLPNPSVYLIFSRMQFPFQATLMPVAKRLLIKQLAKAA
jgi:hypothetical protein